MAVVNQKKSRSGLIDLKISPMNGNHIQQAEDTKDAATYRQLFRYLQSANI